MAARRESGNSEEENKFESSTVSSDNESVQTKKEDIENKK